MDLQQLGIRGCARDALDSGGEERLHEAARQCRLWALAMTTIAGSGHPAGSLSSMEMFLLTYGVADLTPENCDGLDRDHVVVSHGHTSPGVYAALAAWGFFDSREAVAHFRQAGSAFQGHVEREVPGIDWGTGNLGQGLAAGAGYALAQQLRGSTRHTYVLMSDGEQGKGQIAEARRIIVKYNLPVTVLVDWNHIQISGRVEEVMDVPIRKLWEADGWEVLHVDGHDPAALYEGLRYSRNADRPVVLLCSTRMGRGVPFMEDVPDYHGKAASAEQLEEAFAILGGDLAMFRQAGERREAEAPAKGREVAPLPVAIDIGEPITYPADRKTDNRSAFGAALADVGERNGSSPTPLAVFDCDLAGSVKVKDFAKRCPEHFFELGIQEHATATVAGAASAGGVVPVWADFGVFGIDEAYNQQRLNDINRTSLTLALTHVGLDVGEDGMTHQCIDYVGLLRNLFGWRLIVPADPNQADRATRYALGEAGNVCLAMGRSKLPVLTGEDGAPLFGGDYSFTYGAVDRLRAGDDAAILTMGHMAWRALQARELLEKQGCRCAVYHVASPLDLDREALREAARTGCVVTYEDHNVRSGLGSLIAAELCAMGVRTAFASLGVSRYGASGGSDQVIAEMGLSPADLADAVMHNLSGGK
ncbi:MAG: transketolase [Synergistales bacterium]|nr:transketolase [Synergistales bacterium]